MNTDAIRAMTIKSMLEAVQIYAKLYQNGLAELRWGNYIGCPHTKRQAMTTINMARTGFKRDATQLRTWLSEGAS